MNDTEILRSTKSNFISGTLINQKKEHTLICYVYLDFIAEFFAPYALASFPCIRGVSRLYNEALNSPKRYETSTERMDENNVFSVIHSTVIQCSGSGKSTGSWIRNTG
jgi:hypothetical protein